MASLHNITTRAIEEILQKMDWKTFTQEELSVFIDAIANNFLRQNYFSILDFAREDFKLILTTPKVNSSKPLTAKETISLLIKEHLNDELRRVAEDRQLLD
jgi:hypothetical protein